MKLSTEVLLASRQSRRMIIVMTISLIGLIVTLVVLEACSPITGNESRIPIQVTTVAVEENAYLPIELTLDAALMQPITTHVASILNVNENAWLSNVVNGKAKVAAGLLDYQIIGQNSVSVGTNEEVPIGTDVRIWNNDDIVKMELDDGSVIMLNPFTVIRLINIEQMRRFPIVRVILVRGSILVISENFWIISADYNYRIQVNGSMAGVNYEPLQNTITVNCFGLKGNCSFYSLSNTNELTPGQQLEYKGIIRGNIGSVDLEAWRLLYGDILPTLTPRPTFTQISTLLTPRPTFTPTSTFTPTPVITPTQIPTTAAPTHRNPDDSGRIDKDRDGGGGGGGQDGGGGDGGKGG
jgi:hypothetical protein